MTKILAALLLLLPMLAWTQELKPVAKAELATILGLLDELASTSAASAQPYIVRVYAVPFGVYECGGTVASCPDVRLFVTVSNGDLGETPVLYQLPLQKGWEFKGWGSPTTTGPSAMASIILRTVLPESNIDLGARNAWRSREYRVLVSPESASYSWH